MNPLRRNCEWEATKNIEIESAASHADNHENEAKARHNMNTVVG